MFVTSLSKMYSVVALILHTVVNDPMKFTVELYKAKGFFHRALRLEDDHRRDPYPWITERYLNPDRL